MSMNKACYKIYFNIRCKQFMRDFGMTKRQVANIFGVRRIEDITDHEMAVSKLIELTYKRRYEKK